MKLIVQLLLLSLFLPAVGFGQQIEGGPIGCAGSNSHFQRIRLSGKVLLNKNFLPQKVTAHDLVVKEAIELQIKHMMGFFKNTRSISLNVALSAYRGNLKIEKTENTNYGDNITLDRYLPASRAESSLAYVQNAVARGAVKADDPAELVTYQTELVIADCSEKAFFNFSDIRLPLDPYLSLWLESKENRKLRKFGNDQAEISSCSSNELILFGNSDSNWFFWSPVEAKVDQQGKSVKCQIVGTKKIYEPILLPGEEITPAQPLQKSFFSDLKNFKSVSIFGTISNSDLFAKMDIATMKKFILETIQQCQSKANVPSCMTAWQKMLLAKDGKYLEPGTYNFFLFLKYLTSVAKIDSMSLLNTDMPNDEIHVNYKGRFLDSKMPLEGAVYYGSTTFDYGPPATKDYVKLLHSAMMSADSISYVGHAGLGQNVKMEKYKELWRRDHLPEIHRNKPLWFGIYNCEGFSYFGFDQEQIFEKGKMNLLLTESSGTESGAKFPLAQLSILNQIFSSKSADNTAMVKNNIANYVQSREFSTEVRLKN